MLDISTARALLARTRPTRNADGYPAEVRAAVAALASHLLREGRSIGGIARELGLHRSTVISWLDARSLSSGSFVPVVLAEDAGSDVEPDGCSAAEPSAAASGGRPTIAGEADAAGAPTRLTLVSPGGYRLEGLDLDSAVLALSRLG